MSRKLMSFESLVVAGVAAWIVAGSALAEVRPEVVERIKPVGQVTLTGQAAAPAAAADAPTEAVAKAEPAPAAQAEPAAPAAEAVVAGAVDGEAVYARACFACHMSGAANAPKIGDKEAWGPRIAKGREALYSSAMNGIPGTAMAPRGSCAACSDEELKAAVDFMASKAE